MEKITCILDRKLTHFLTISPHSTAANALNKMCCENVEYLVVIDDDDHYIGLLSEHDISAGVVFTNKLLAKTKVIDIMNKRLPVATAEDTGHDAVSSIAYIFLQYHQQWLPGASCS